MAETRKKAIKLFTYLKELSALRTTQAKDIEKYDQVLWFSDIPKEKNCNCIAWDLLDSKEDEEASRSDLWMEVHKPRLKSPPKVSDDLEPWIEVNETYDSNLEEPNLLEEILETLPPDEETGEERTIVRSINDHPEIVDLWIEYIEKNWGSWAEEDRRLQQIQHVYNDLYSIYQRAEKLGEQYEVVVSIGFLLWDAPNSGKVRHPVLTLQGRVEFDPLRGIMSVRPSLEGPQAQLETDMLETDDRPSVSDLQGIQSMVNELADDPWNGPSLDAILKSFANGISTQSKYENLIERPIHITESPTLHFAPAIILRKRTLRTYVDYYGSIIDQLEHDEEILEGVIRLVEIAEDESRGVGPVMEKASSPEGILDSELYFPLKANDEQKRIAHIIEQHQGVLVEGPPGTGKSHTIANLIAHFLAKGKRILVTSETPRALKVLKEMLPQEISELCVIWLGAGPDAQISLEKSVQAITQMKNNWDPITAADEIKHLEKDLDTVRRNRAVQQKDLTALREADTYQHDNVFNQYSGTLEGIAIQINKERYQYSWMLDRPNQNDEPKVNSNELLELNKINRQLTEETLQEIEMKHLPGDILIMPVEFRKLVDIELRASALHNKSEQLRNYPGYKSFLNLDHEQRLRLLKLLKDLLHRMDQLSKNVHGWVDRAAREIVSGQDRVWRKLLDVTNQNIQIMETRIQEITGLRISGLDGYDPVEAAMHAEELKLYLDRGGTLGFGPFRKKHVKQALYLIKKVRVEGKSCTSPEVLQRVIDWLDFKRRLNDLSGLWKAYTTPPQGEYSFQLAEYQNL
ncbi:AAA domain-containing protein, partial [Acidobacteriota bacterium]